MNDTFQNLNKQILKSLQEFKEDKTLPRQFDFGSLSQNLDTQKTFDRELFQKEILLHNSGWIAGTELIPIQWVSKVVSGILLGYSPSFEYHILFLKAISYHGFFGLYKLLANSIDPKVISPEQAFNLAKTRAKYYKDHGEFVISQNHYRETIQMGQQIDSLPYALSLQSKLYSDYLQRDGLCLSYSKIAFDKSEKATDKMSTTFRRYQITADAYAKEIYPTNPKAGEHIYKELLTYDNESLNLQRVKFRYYEAKILHSIASKSFKGVFKYLKKYEYLIDSVTYNPKAIYIRRINLISYYRKIKDHLRFDKAPFGEEEFLLKFDSLNDGAAIYMLENCIKMATTFNDSRFFALAHYEKSFWIENSQQLNTTQKAIECLMKGLVVFSDNKQAIINKIYCDILKRLSELNVQNNKWNVSLKYYQKLYDYLSFLSIKLKEDRDIVELFLNDNAKLNKLKYPELNCLTIEELKTIRFSLLLDYEALNRRLVDYGRNINLIQSDVIATLQGIMENQLHIIWHDLSTDIIGFENTLKYIKQAYSKKATIKDLETTLKEGEFHINRAKSNRDGFSKVTLNDFLIPTTIDLNDELSSRIELIKNNYSSKNLILSFKRYPERIYTKLSKVNLKSLIENFVNNALFVSKRNNIDALEVKLSIIREQNIFFLEYSDNCGDYHFFAEKVIKKINNDQEPVSKKNRDGRGNGLLTLKRIIATGNWVLSGDDHLKSVRIPIEIIEKVNEEH